MEKKQALAEQAYRSAYDCELEYGCCSQCVLVSIKETIGVISEDVIQASHGLAGGGALSGFGACGALAGGLIALSCNHAPAREDFNRGGFTDNYRMGAELVEMFRREFGGVTCEDLQERFTGLKWDVWDMRQFEQFKRQRGDRCAHATAMVARWVVEML
jgi:C_GCAxxG_C_C family probable redox protein